MASVAALFMAYAANYRRADDLFRTMARQPERALTVGPGPNRWSVLSHLDHLVQAETAVMTPVPSRMPRAAHRLRFWFVCAILKNDIPVPVPAESMLPLGRPCLAAVREDWEGLQGQVRAFLNRLPETDADVGCYHHPVIGPLTPMQALVLNRFHYDTHCRQINRLLQHPSNR